MRSLLISVQPLTQYPKLYALFRNGDTTFDNGHLDNYVVKVMELKNERIPKIILNNMIRTRGSMMVEWESLTTECGINLLIGQDENSSSLRFKFNDILEKLEKVLYDRNVVEARSSVFKMLLQPP